MHEIRILFHNKKPNASIGVPYSALLCRFECKVQNITAALTNTEATAMSMTAFKPHSLQL